MQQLFNWGQATDPYTEDDHFDANSIKIELMARARQGAWGDQALKDQDGNLADDMVSGFTFSTDGGSPVDVKIPLSLETPQVK